MQMQQQMPQMPQMQQPIQQQFNQMPQMQQQQMQRPQQSMYQKPAQSMGMNNGSGFAVDKYKVDTTRCNLIPLNGVHPYLDRNWYIRVG